MICHNKKIWKFSHVTLVLFALAGFSSACGKKPRQKPDNLVTKAGLAATQRPPITGVVIDSAPIANARLELHLMRSRPVPSDTTVHAAADAEGRFSIVPREAGPYELLAFLPLEPEAPYVAFVLEHAQGPVVVSPLSTITAGLVRHARRLDPMGDHALTSSFAAMSAHLQIPHLELVEPARLPLPVDPMEITPAAQAQLVVQGLERIAHGFLDKNQSVPVAPSLAQLCTLLADDLEADGTIDGQGTDGKRLTVAGSGYDGSILRTLLAQHVLDVVGALASNDGATAARREKYCDTARRLVYSAQTAVRQPPFPPRFSCQTQHLTVSGQVPFKEASLPWQVDAWSIDSTGAITQRRSSSLLDHNDYNFSLDIYGDTGPLLIRAYPQGQDATYFFDYILPPSQDCATVETSLNPLSTLSAAYSRHLLRQGHLPFPDAIDSATRVLNQHFGADVHSTDISSDFNAKLWLAADAPLGNNHRASLLCIALGHLSDVSSRFSDDTPFRSRRLLQLTWLLAEDVGADATFDGEGETRRPLTMEGYPLSASTLRTDLTHSVLSCLHAAQTASADDHLIISASTSTAEAQGWARSLSETTSAPFFSIQNSVSSCGPSFTDRCVIREGSTKRPLSETLRGIVGVECTVEPGVFLAHANIMARVADSSVPEGTTIVQKESNGNHRSLLSFTIDTRQLSAIGGSETTADLFISATNTLGVTEKTQLTLLIDNTKPTIKFITNESKPSKDNSTMWMGRDEALQTDLEVTGRPPFEVTATNENLDITLSTKGGIDKIIGSDTIARTYHLTAKRKPDANCTICSFEIKVSDDAENKDSVTLLARWPDQGPSFAEPAITYAAFDHFRNDAIQSPRIHPEHSLNAVSHRYANHLDYAPEHQLPPASDPLPELRFHFNQDDPNGTPAESVEYRATPYTNSDFTAPALAEPMPWRAAHAPAGTYSSVYVLPLSFQTLLPEHLLAHPTTARNSARMLIHNRDLSGPAAWKIEVRATDRFGYTSDREAYVVFDVRLPPARLVHASHETGWCSYDATRAAQRPHADLAMADLLWPTFRSDHSLFSRPVLRVDVHYPVPPVTYIDKTEWFIEPIRKPQRSAKGKDSKSWENQKAWECERRLDNNWHGLWVEQWDHCIGFPNAQYYDKAILPGSELLPLDDQQRLWILSHPRAPVTFLLDERFQQLEGVTAKMDDASYFTRPTSVHISGVAENTRAKISDSKALVYGDNKREERWFYEHVVAASTIGTIRWDFSVEDPFLKLNMDQTWVTKDISCRLQPPPPRKTYSWEKDFHGIPTSQKVPTAANLH